MDNAPSDADDVAAAFAHGGAVGALAPTDINKHLDNIRKGNTKIAASMKMLFDTPKSMPKAEADIKAREKMTKYLEAGGIEQSLREAQYAQNSQSSDSPLDDMTLGTHYPAQNILMNASRVARENYLNSLRPSDKSVKLPFDDEPDHTQATRTYNQALDLANDPLAVIPEIGHGTLEQSHVQHLSAMAPELTDLLKRKFTEKITQAQLKGNKPPYHVRQGLSLFMGTDLSSEMLPQNVQAAQAVFVVNQTNPAPQLRQGAKPKRSTSPLSKADQAYLTPGQARQERSQKT